MGRVRAIAYVSGDEVRLVSCCDKEMAASYPELAVLTERVHFGLVQSRMHVRRPAARLIQDAPPSRPSQVMVTSGANDRRYLCCSIRRGSDHHTLGAGLPLPGLWISHRPRRVQALVAASRRSS